jgi:hypothetical protein
MSNQQLSKESTAIAVLAGIFTGFCTDLHKDDIIRTVILAALGAVVSFTVSSLLHEIKHRLKR